MRNISSLRLALSLIYFTAAAPLSYSEDSDTSSQQMESEEAEEGFTINFNNVSIVEFVRFAAKITNLNFIFDETELQFNMTLVSEEPISPANIMSVLTQVLRIHSFSLIEQGNSILITQSKAVNQIPPIISSDSHESKLPNIPIVTRIFRIKNANLNTVATIIRSMTSQSALIEVSAETHQLIVTDIIPNVDKIATLLTSLDAPHSPLEIDSYSAKQIGVAEIVALTDKIITPFAGGNPFILVPQGDTSTIFIVSTPSLIERALNVMADVDVASKGASVGASENVFIYKVINRDAQDLKGALTVIAQDLQSSPTPPAALINSLLSGRVITESSSIMFVASPDVVLKLQELLANVDVMPSLLGKDTFYLYKLQATTPEQMEAALTQLVHNLQNSQHPDQELINAILSVKWIKDTNTAVFTGKERTLALLKELVPTFDMPTAQVSATGSFWIYHPQNRTGDELQTHMQEIATNLKNSGLADPGFLNVIASMKWVPSSNTLTFTGDSQTLARVEEMVKNFDVPRLEKPIYYLYKLVNAQGPFVIDNLKNVAANLTTSGVSKEGVVGVINNIKWMSETNSLLITGMPSEVEDVKSLIAQFDTAGISSPSQKSVFFIYKPLQRDPHEIESTLKGIAQDLQTSGLSDPDLIQTIGTLRYIDATHSLLFTGTPDSLEKVKALLGRIDIPSGLAPGIQQLSNATFLIYKIQYVDPTQFAASLKKFADDLGAADSPDKELIRAINTMKVIQETNSVLFTGSEKILEKVEALAQKFDNSALAPQIQQGPSAYVIYTPKNQTGEELIGILCDFEQNLIRSGVQDPALFTSINTLKWIDKTSTLLISGDQESISKVQSLLDRFDVPSKGGANSNIQSIDNTSFLVYKLQYHQGSEIQEALRQIAANFSTPLPGSTTPAPANMGLAAAVNTMQWIKVTNSLLVSGQQETLTKLKDLIQNLDVPLRQVFIEVLIVETSLANSQSFGLQWGGKIKYFNKGIGSFNNLPAANPQNITTIPPNNVIGSPLDTINPIATPPVYPAVNNLPTSPPTTGFDLGMIGDIIMHKGRSFFSLATLVNALQTDNDSTIILNPKIITQDNNNSTIFIGQNIPFIGSSVQQNGQVQTINSNVEYRDVGVNLSITPLLGNGDVVTLDISNDLSEQIQTTVSTGNSNLTGLQTSHTSMNTRVHVPNNHFLVLSGMIRDNKTHFKSGIPCLGGLPVIGAAFSQNDRLNAKDNIIFFVRPHIIDSYDEYKELTSQQEALYKEQAVLPVLKEQFDAGVDIVKQPENE